MSLSVPVIASRVGGIPDILSDGVEGRLVDPGEPKALADAVRQVVADSVVRVRMGQAAQARSVAYHLDQVATTLEGAYRDAISLHDRGLRRNG
jgi:glycosyltransferase involved in cell wall biosynthesis